MQKTHCASGLLAALLVALLVCASCTGQLETDLRDGSGSSPDGSSSQQDSGGGGNNDGSGGGTHDSRGPIVTPRATCQPVAGGGSTTVAAPTVWRNFNDSYHEGWVASPAVADLDGDGQNEIIAARDTRLVVWKLDGQVRFVKDFD